MDSLLRSATRKIWCRLPASYGGHWRGSHLAAIAKNFAWLSGDRFVRMGISFLTGAAVARYLEPHGFGVLTCAIAIAELAGVFATLGLESILPRELLRKPASAVELLGTAFWSSCAAMVILYAALILPLAEFGSSSPEASTCLLLAGLLMIRAPLSVLNFQFAAQLQARFGVIAATLSFVFGTVVRLLLIWQGAPVTAFAAALLIEPSGTGLLLYVFNRRAGMRPSTWRWKFVLAKALLQESWPLVFSSFATMIYMRSDQVMLAYLQNEEEAGRFGAALRLSEVWYFLPASLASSLLPALVRTRDLSATVRQQRMQRFYDLNATMAYGLILLLLPAAPWIFPLVFGRSYAGADAVFQIHIWACPFVFLGVARNQYLLIEGWTRFLFFSTALGAVINVALNLLFIPRWGASGAAIATLVSQASATLVASFGWLPARVHGWAQLRALLVPIRSLVWLARSAIPATRTIG